MRVRRPSAFIFSTTATESVPTIDHAPEQTSGTVYVSGPMLKIVRTKTGRKLFREKPKGGRTQNYA
jgi:hypothetical protein